MTRAHEYGMSKGDNELQQGHLDEEGIGRSIQYR